MASFVANFLVCLSSFMLLLLVSRSGINGARVLEGTGGDQDRIWKDITQHSTPIPEALKGLLPRVQIQTKTEERITEDCHTGTRGTIFTDKPRPDISVYASAGDKNEKLQFVTDFDQTRPDVSSYPEKLQFVKDFEPRPDVTSYPEKLQFVKDFEPRPDLTSYPEKLQILKDFDPRPNVSAYPEKLQIVKDIKTTPDVTAYPQKLQKDFEPRLDARAHLAA